MSFLNIDSQRGGPSETGEGGEDRYTKLLNEFGDRLRQFNKDISKIGISKWDSLELRQSIESELIPQCNTLRDDIETSLDDTQRNTKLYTDFLMLKDELNNCIKMFDTKKRKYPLVIDSLGQPRNATSEVTSQRPQENNYSYTTIQVDEQQPLLAHSASLQQQQQQQSLQQEINYHTIIQQERSQEVSRIHNAVQEVNAIFTQLGTLVKEQGENVDKIDANIGNLSNNMQNANTQLRKADEHQRQRNRCGLMALIILIVFSLILILVLLG